MPRPARLLVPVLVLTLVACGGGGDDGGGDSPEVLDRYVPDANPGLPPQITVTPEATGDGWTVSTPAAEGLDAGALLAAMQSIRDGNAPRVDSMVVARNGRLVAEGYFNGFGRETRHDLRSTGKSFTSALAGIAASQGLLGLDDPIAAHIPNYDGYRNIDARKRAITYRHLLDMDSGFECDDGWPASQGNEEYMYRTRDWIRFTLDLPMTDQPGTHPRYCTAGTVLLGHLVSLRTGVGLDEYANTWLFGPLNIRDANWRRSPDGRATGGGGLRLRPRDLAKFGALYANEGTWNGARVIPEAWVARSRERVNVLNGQAYGNLWWKRSYVFRGAELETFHTSGNGGNLVMVFPALELVVVYTGSNYNDVAGNQPYTLVGAVLGAVQ